MNWINDNVALVTMILAFPSGVVALLQWRRSINIQRSQFINSILDKLRSDKDIADALYLVESSEAWYNEDFYGGSHNEFIVDKLLACLSYICYLKKTHNITKKSV